MIIKKKISLFLLGLTAILPQLYSCTTFLINSKGQLVFGRNYDWVSETGIVCTNLKGLQKTSLKVPDGSTINWISKYGSITFNQYGKEFPTGGMNEKGLVVELMWEDATQYPSSDKRAALDVLQWVQYQLDNHASVDEVIGSDKTIRISAASPPLHYLVADSKGNAATIEFINGKMKVHKGKDLPFPVLTNTTYTESVKIMDNAGTAAAPRALTDNSLQRFATACSMVQKYQSAPDDMPATEYAFDILKAVSQGNFTKWSIVYDIRNMKILFKTASRPGLKSLQFSSFRFDCTSEPLAFNMNSTITGSIENNFNPYKPELNAATIEKAGEESKTRIRVTKEAVSSRVNYPQNIKCAL
jgi:penicillin V acylase-like amidase (Ntn superfamily)